MKRRAGPGCDRKAVENFDYSGLSEEFSKLVKPAQRALLNNGIRTPSQLARRTLEEVKGFHAMGPSSIPKLKSILRKHGLAFKKGS